MQVKTTCELRLYQFSLW